MSLFSVQARGHYGTWEQVTADLSRLLGKEIGTDVWSGDYEVPFLLRQPEFEKALKHVRALARKLVKERRASLKKQRDHFKKCPECRRYYERYSDPFDDDGDLVCVVWD